MRKVLAGVAAAMLSVTALAVPAQAAQGDCGSGYTCMWENHSYGGGAVSFKYYIPDLSQYKLTNGKKANDVVSSVKNRGTMQGSCLFTDANGRGYSLYVAKGHSVQNLANYAHMNDTISSGYFEGYKKCD